MAKAPRGSVSGASGISVRRAIESDAEAIAAIYNDAVLHTVATFDLEPRSLDAQRGWLREHTDPYAVFVAQGPSGVVGWASLSRWSERRAYAGTAEVSVYVDASWRGRKVGGALLTALVRQAVLSGLHTLLARVADGNPASLRLHAAQGFRTLGTMREVGRKFDRWIDVDLLQLPLPSAGSTVPTGPPAPPSG
jgi:L-amino acid N-acyltransferase